MNSYISDIDQEIAQFLPQLSESCTEILSKLEQKKGRLWEKENKLTEHKEKEFKEIDLVFDELIKLLNQRREALKEEYILLEKWEKSRITKYRRILKTCKKEIDEYLEELTASIEEFDKDLEFSANRSMFKSLYNQFIQLESHSTDKPNIFKEPKFELPTFQFLHEETEGINKLGKVVDNRSHSEPLVSFNTTDFSLQEYSIKEHKWNRITLDDEELKLLNLSYYFTTVYIPLEKYILLGGYTPEENCSSEGVFMFQEGHITRYEGMFHPRQFFACVLDAFEQYIYVIGGYSAPNSQEPPAILNNCERFRLVSRKWEEIEPLNVGRMNPGICTFGGVRIYVFGGTRERSFVSSIERYNSELNIWNPLEIQLPIPISNIFTKQVSNSHILIAGGVRRRIAHNEQGDTQRNTEFENSDSLYLLDVSAGVFQTYPHGFQFKKRMSGMQVNHRGHAYCLFMNKPTQVPEMHMIDINDLFPNYSRYSHKFSLKRQIGKVDFGGHTHHGEDSAWAQGERLSSPGIEMCDMGSFGGRVIGGVSKEETKGQISDLGNTKSED